jgi:predicted NBD/HSP70 family sugar kinase
MICDAEKEIGIAGIMGGENSMITDDVKTVVFEAACFNGTNIRLSAKRIGLQTDASGKFDKGLDPNNTLEAIDRACHWLAVATGSMINLLNPDLILYGGGVIAAMGETFLKKILAEVDRYCMPQIRSSVDIKIAALGDDSILYGDLALIEENLK